MKQAIKEILKGIAVGVGTAIVLQVINALGGFLALQWVWNKIFVDMWPMWIGLLAACLYWLITFFIRIHKQLTAIEDRETRAQNFKEVLRAAAEMSKLSNKIKPP